MIVRMLENWIFDDLGFSSLLRIFLERGRNGIGSVMIYGMICGLFLDH